MDENQLLKPRTVKDHLKAFATASLMVFLPLLGLELCLQVFDPWGIRFFDDMAIFGTALENDAIRGYILPDGVYELSNWTITMENGSRHIPNTNAAADCKIVALGDSFTFAYGVDDDKAWLNYIAAEFPQVYFINTGLTAYNSANVLGAWQSFPDADAYFYFSTDNDWEPNLSPGDMVYDNPSAVLPLIVRYAKFFSQREAAVAAQAPLSAEELLSSPRFQRYFEDMQRINQIENLSIITWEQNFMRPALDELGIQYQLTPLIPGHAISIVDGHYNIEGNRLFAENLKPFFEAIILEHCP